MRFMRNSVVAFRFEASLGSADEPDFSSNAMLVSNLSITPIVAQNVERELIRGTFGNFEQLVGDHYVECEFEVELAGSGDAASAPIWSPLLQVCNYAELVHNTSAAYAQVVFKPYSFIAPTHLSAGGIVADEVAITAHPTGSLYYHMDGLTHKMKYVRGTFSIMMNIGTRPTLKFKMTGLDAGVEAITAARSVFSNWQTPITVIDSHTSTINLHNAKNWSSILVTSLNTTPPGITGGTNYQSRGLEIDIGNDIKFVPLLDGASNLGNTIQITDRKSTGKMTLNLSAAEASTLYTDVLQNTLFDLAFQHGTTAGNKIGIYAPSVQLLNPSYQDQDGIVLMSFDLRFIPEAAGDNEVYLITY